MAHRQFTDSSGLTWDVWDVHPTTASQTLAALSRQGGDAGLTPCHAVAPGLAAGWLCFEQGPERRRLAPIPQGWEQLVERELERLRDCASRVPGPEERQRRATGDQSAPLPT